MKFIVPKEDILDLLNKQLNFFFINEEEYKILCKHYEEVLSRCEVCFSKNPNKYFFDEGITCFNPFHSVQYMIFLYYFGNTIYKSSPGNSILYNKIYYLNKMLNSVDIFPAVELPSFFMAEHPVGSVIGRAKIGSGFMFFQNCTIGGIERGKEKKEVYPILGDNVTMYAATSIIGDCRIGDNVNLGAGTMVKNQDIPDNHNVFGISPNLILRPKNKYNHEK